MLRFIIFLCLVVGLAALGGRHDVLIINQGCGLAEGAKLLGNAIEISVVLLAAFLLERGFWRHLLFIIIGTLLWWIAHDININLGLGVGIDYIGQGSFDQFFGRIFQQSGWLYLGFRAFILIILSLSYLSVKDE